MITLTPPIKSSVSAESGFTLLEIIAVLVIMSILAVVAVPKFFDLQEKARIKAMETGRAEAISRVNSYFASQVLSGVKPENIEYTTAKLGPDMGDDFTMAVESAADAGTIVILITGGTGTAVDGTTIRASIPRPGFK